VALLAGIALLLAGCARAEELETEKGHASVSTFLAACAQDEGEPALETLTEPARRTFLAGGDTAESCERILDLLGPRMPPPAEARDAFGRARVTEIRVNGGIGSAVVELGGRRSELDLELVSSEWKVSNPPLLSPSRAPGSPFP
jgi:hypothetical protein